MNETTGPVRPETLALDALIKETVTLTAASTHDGATDTLLFLGNRHHAFPTAMIRDPVLAPVDKLVWMVIMLEVRETGGNTAFPGYGSIAGMANISSRSTISRAISILRATRWLTLCGRLRKASGRFQGNLYALHDEPLPLADAIHLDGDYMAFLNKSLAHGHARVRTVAQGVLASIDEDIRAGRNVCAREHPIERRVQAMAGTASAGSRRFFSFTRNVIRTLQHDSMGTGNASDHHDQNSNMDKEHRVRNSNTVSSSSYIYKTTTTVDSGMSKFDITGEGGKRLIYPKRLGDNQREIANRYLRPLSAVQRQLILDELEGRFQAELKGMKPVYDEISFLIRLCKSARVGKFQPNLGIRVRESRCAQESARHRAAQRDTTTALKETDEQRQKRMTRAQDRLMTMRKALTKPER
ncbi:MAG: helix-turn-helix domain-containing protein [Gammaproteobacteria bacterium]|nr:helix-turn-helix domain-containing protein [Gammaproteobacteria bacterium]